MARFLAAEARAAGLDVPAFRSPPRVSGAARTIRRMGDGAVVSIRIRGRSSEEVAADMIEGIVIANRLAPAVAAPMRERLRASVAPVDIDLTLPDDGAADPRPTRNLAAHARMAERQTQAA